MRVKYEYRYKATLIVIRGKFELLATLIRSAAEILKILPSLSSSIPFMFGRRWNWKQKSSVSGRWCQKLPIRRFCLKWWKACSFLILQDPSLERLVRNRRLCPFPSRRQKKLATKLTLRPRRILQSMQTDELQEPSEMGPKVFESI